MAIHEEDIDGMPEKALLCGEDSTEYTYRPEDEERTAVEGAMAAYAIQRQSGERREEGRYRRRAPGAPLPCTMNIIIIISHHSIIYRSSLIMNNNHQHTEYSSIIRFVAGIVTILLHYHYHHLHMLTIPSSSFFFLYITHYAYAYDIARWQQQDGYAERDVCRERRYEAPYTLCVRYDDVADIKIIRYAAPQYATIWQWHTQCHVMATLKYTNIRFIGLINISPSFLRLVISRYGSLNRISDIIIIILFIRFTY